MKDKLMEQWNVRAPLLSLWSRSDWTATHRAIAAERGHSQRGPEKPNLEIPTENPRKRRRPDEEMAAAVTEPPLAGDKDASDMDISPSQTDHQHHSSGRPTWMEDATYPSSLYHHQPTSGGSRWAYGEELRAPAAKAAALSVGPSSFCNDRPASGGGRWVYREELPAHAPREVLGYAEHGAARSVPSGVATAGPSSFYHDRLTSCSGRGAYDEELLAPAAAAPARHGGQGYAGHGAAPLVPSRAAMAGPSSFCHDQPSSGSTGGRWGYGDDLPAAAAMAGPSSFYHERPTSGEGRGCTSLNYGEELTHQHGGGVPDEGPSYERLPAAPRREGLGHAGHGGAPSVPSCAATAGPSGLYHGQPASGGGRWAYGEELGRHHAAGSASGADPSYERLQAAARREGLCNTERSLAASSAPWHGGLPRPPPRGSSGGWLDE